MNYKPMQSTFIYNQLKDAINNTIQGSMREGKILSETELEEQFMMIKKYTKSAIKSKVLAGVSEGTIRLIYAPDNIQRFSYLPFIMTVNNGKLCANIMVSTFGNMREDGSIYMSYQKLYSLMESAYLAKNFLNKYDRFRNNNVLIAQGSTLYANMFVKPINKRFNVHTDRERENKILFLAAKFYLKNVLGLQNNEIVFNNAMKACKGGNPFILKELDTLIPDEAFTDLGTFIEALKNDNLNLGLIGLSARGYLELFISLYGQSTIFALELLPYFLFVGNSAINSIGIVNNYSLEDLMEKGMAKILAQLYM